MALDFPASPTTGQTYVSGGQIWTYNGSGWASSYQSSGVTRQQFTATAGQTSFTVTGGYLANLVDVYQNGVKLINGTDATVTSGTAVVLATGATVNDIIEVIGVSAFAVANYLPLAGGTLSGGLSGTTGAFSGAVSASNYGAVNGTTGAFSGGVSGTTGTFSAAVSGSTIADATATIRPLVSTARVTLSGTATVISTAIPSWAKRITLTIAGLTTSSTSQIIVQIGSGSYASSGYLGTSTASASSSASYAATAGFCIANNDGATQVAHGTMTICLQNAATNTWVESLSGAYSNRAMSFLGGGSVSLGGVLDRIQITTVGGTDTFTAGSIGIMWE
jgi:hypothetical protein